MLHLNSEHLDSGNQKLQLFISNLLKYGLSSNFDTYLTKYSSFQGECHCNLSDASVKYARSQVFLVNPYIFQIFLFSLC